MGNNFGDQMDFFFLELFYPFQKVYLEHKDTKVRITKWCMSTKKKVSLPDSWKVIELNTLDKKESRNESIYHTVHQEFNQPLYNSQRQYITLTNDQVPDCERYTWNPLLGIREKPIEEIQNKEGKKKFMTCQINSLKSQGLTPLKKYPRYYDCDLQSLREIDCFDDLIQNMKFLNFGKTREEFIQKFIAMNCEKNELKTHQPEKIEVAEKTSSESYNIEDISKEQRCTVDSPCVCLHAEEWRNKDKYESFDMRNYRAKLLKGDKTVSEEINKDKVWKMVQIGNFLKQFKKIKPWEVNMNEKKHKENYN